MKRLLLFFSAFMAVYFLAGSVVQARDFKYVGVKSCAKCHKKDKQGRQLAIWEESEHSKAFEVLALGKAQIIAKGFGVNGDPQKAEACLVCHSTGFGLPPERFKIGFKVEQGVQCEACHGPGEKYKKKTTMKKISEERGPDKKGISETAKATGLIIPDEKTCKSCHAKEKTWNGKTYRNPSYKPFDYKKKFEKIKHPRPSS